MSVSLYDGGGGKTVQQLKRTRFYSCAPGTPGLENSEAARASPRNSKNRIIRPLRSEQAGRVHFIPVPRAVSLRV